MPSRSSLLALWSLLAAFVVASCGVDDFADRTAVVEVGDVEWNFTLESCGLDGETVFLVGRSDGGAVLQAVVGLDDSGDADPDQSGFSVLTRADDHEWGAFGAQAWDRREGPGEPPGQVTSANLVGSRSSLSGTAELIEPGSGSTPFSLDARCDEE